MLDSGGAEEGGGVWAGNVLLLFRINVRESYEGQKYTFLQFTEMTYPTDTVDAILRCIRLSAVMMMR